MVGFVVFGRYVDRIGLVFKVVVIEKLKCFLRVVVRSCCWWFFWCWLYILVGVLCVVLLFGIG